MNEPEFILGSGSMEPADSEHSSSLKIWDYSDSESAPASSWSTIPNRRVMEDNRKLAVARHKRNNGRSEFIVAQSTKGILGPGDDSFVGSVTSNLIGSKYNIWDQPHAVSELNEKSFWKMFDTGLYEQCMRKYGAIS
ncbi:hypothetical protein AgCh_015567 [Apium graveolens]